MPAIGPRTRAPSVRRVRFEYFSILVFEYSGSTLQLQVLPIHPATIIITAPVPVPVPVPLSTTGLPHKHNHKSVGGKGRQEEQLLIMAKPTRVKVNRKHRPSTH